MVMKLFYAFLCGCFALFWCNAAAAQLPKDSIFVRFHSDFEKWAFERPRDKKPNEETVIALLMATDSTCTKATFEATLAQYRTLVRDLEAQKPDPKKMKKTARMIFSAVHDRYLKLYNLNIQLNSLFTEGTYNCLTATAVYGLLFEHFEIPYAVILMPDHVFAVVDPYGEPILFESTDPATGLAEVDVDKLVSELLKQKIITKEAGLSNAELYKKYFDRNNRSISLYELCGAAYKNQSIYAAEDKDFATAFYLAEKARLLLKEDNLNEHRKSVLANWADLATIDTVSTLEPLFILMGYPDIRMKVSDIIGRHYNHAMKKFLVDENDEEKYNEVYQFMLARLWPKTELWNDIVFSKHYLKGSLLVETEAFSEAITVLDSAYQIKPNHREMQSLLASAIILKHKRILNAIDPNSFDDFEPDTATIRKTLTELLDAEERYSFLTKQSNFQSAVVFLQLFRSMLAFENENLTEGEAILLQLEPRIKNIKSEGSILKEVMPSYYGEVSSLYVRKENYPEAKKWLLRGLERFPNNEELKHRLEMLEEEMED